MPRKPRLRNQRLPVVVVDIPTAAALLDVSPATLYRWISEGKFEYITLPSGVMKISLLYISEITGLALECLMNVVRPIK